MYMPKGIIHFALSGPEGSSHLTISLERQGLAWADALVYGGKMANIHDSQFESRWTSAIRTLIGDDMGVPFLEAMPSWSSAGGEDGLCAAQDSTTESQARFLQRYGQLCHEVLPFVMDAYIEATDLTVFLDAARIDAMTERVCTAETAESVRKKLCADGVLPVDVTSSSFKKAAGARSNPNRASERSRRSSSYVAYTCNTGCDESCNRFTCGCDDGCTTQCNTGCTNCNTGCDDQVCNSGCTTSCDGQTCYAGCDASCDEQTCYAGCDDTCSNCHGGCTAGCDDSCNSSCDFLVFSCDSSCDDSCDDACNTNCDICTTSCDEACVYNLGCDDDCDDSCVFNLDCDDGCNTGCTPTSCDETCTGPCTSGCLTTCTTGCDDCPDTTSCNDDCDDTCTCNPGFYGNGQSCTPCQANTYSPTSGASSCTTCAGCSSGQYRSGCGGSNAGSCVACPSCPSGFERTGCSGTSTGTCTPCAIGYYKTAQDTSACLACPACSDGFTRIGCQGASLGSCVGNQCALPPSIVHASVQTSNSGVYPSTATYTCLTGYELSNSNQRTLTCQTDGSWSGTLPSCVGVPCPSLSLDLGTVSPSGPIQYPNTATFSCQTGYVVQGASTATCRADKTWSAATPTCVGRTCSRLDPPVNGQVTFTNNLVYPSNAMYTCNTGYEVASGDVTRMCSPTTGTYGGVAVQCRGKQCIALNAPAFGSLRYSDSERRYPGTAEFACNPGYEIMGTAVRSCQTNQQWSGASPTCKGVLCPVPTIANADVTTSSSRYPATMTVSCRPGHGLTGASALNCTIAGQWGQLPTCTPCPVDTYQHHPDQICRPCPPGSSTNGRTGTSCVCRPGFEPSKNNDGTCVSCQDNFFKPGFNDDTCKACSPGYETVNGDKTACVGVMCDPVLPVPFARSNVSGTLHYPVTVAYTCQTGFNTSDQTTIRCNTTGAWEPQLPTCQPVCGDGIIVEGEECDDGNRNGQDGCTDCMLDGTHECSDPGQECQRCRVKPDLLPKQQMFPCSEPSLKDKMTAWLANTGHLDPVDLTPHPQCQVTSTSYEISSESGNATCYTLEAEFTVVFNDGAATEMASAGFIVQDHEAPTFVAAPVSPVSASCDNVPEMEDLEASDNCITSPEVSKHEVRSNGKCAQNYNLTRTWTVRDECNNVNSVSQVVMVHDTQAPQFVDPVSHLSLECSGDMADDIESLRLHHANIFATDTCSEGVVRETTITSAAPADWCNTDVQMVVTARDECDNEVQTLVTVHVEDTKGPEPKNMPDDVTVSCAAVPPIPDDVFGTDLCGPRRVYASVSEKRENTACPHTYELHRTFDFTDACGQSTVMTQVVHVEDKTAPTIMQQPETLLLECNEETNAADITAWLERHGGAMAMDDCSLDSVTWTHNYDGVKDTMWRECGGAGQIQVTFTAHDACGLTVDTLGTIVIADTKPPVFESSFDDITVMCDAVPAASTVRAADNCSTSVDVSLDTVKQEGRCTGEYSLINTWTARDECGHSSLMDQVVTVLDTGAPTLHTAAQDQIVECVMSENEDTLGTFLASNGGATASDSCGPVEWLYSDASKLLDVSVRESGEVVRQAGCGNTFSVSAVFYAVDDCDNSVTTSATLVIQDTRKPVLQDPPASPVAVPCDAVPVLANLTALDACDGSLVGVVSEDVLPGRCTHTYVLSRQWTAVDACGLVDTAQQIVSVSDVVAPVITVAAQDLVVECGNETGAVIDAWLATQGGAEAIDSCDATVSWSHDFDEVKHLLEYGCGRNQVRVRFTAVDDCGNAAHTDAYVTVMDTLPPELVEVPRDAVMECDIASNNMSLTTFVSSHGGAIARDLCSGGDELVWTHTAQREAKCGNALDVVVNFTVTDRCGLSVSGMATLTLSDTEAPVLKLAGSNPQASQVGFPWLDPSVQLASDKCHSDLSQFVMVVSPPNVTTLGVYNVSYQVEDACGFIGMATREVDIVDRVPPVVHVLGPRELYVRAGADYYDPGAQATDDYAANPVVEAFVLADGAPSNIVQEAPLVPNRAMFRIMYRATDDSGNSAVHFARTVHVLQPAERNPSAASVTISFDRSVTLAMPSSQGPSWMPGDAAAYGLPDGQDIRYTVARVVLTSSVSRSLFDSSGVADVLGGVVYDYVIKDETQVQSEVHAVLGAVSPDTVQEARASSKVEAMTTPVGVISFHGTVRDNAGSCTGRDAVADALGRKGRTLLHATCEGCLCAYVSAEPASNGQFDIPRLVQAIQHHVTLAATQGGTFSLPVLELKLHQLGIVPVRLRFSDDSDMTRVSFVTRSPMPADPSVFAQARATLVSSQVVVGTRLVLEMTPGVSGLTLLSHLYSVGIVPEQLSFDEPIVNGTQNSSVVVSLETHNDVTNSAVSTLTEIAWIIRIRSIEFMQPLMVLESPWPYNYTVIGASSSTLAMLQTDVREVFDAVGLTSGVGYKFASCSSSGPVSCIVSTSSKLSESTSATLQGRSHVQEVTLAADVSLSSEIISALEVKFVDVLPYPASAISFSGTDVSARRDTLSAVTINFQAPSPDQLVTTVPETSYTIPSDRYILQFSVSGASSTVRERAIVALNANAIPAVEVTVQGEQVTAIVPQKLSDSRLTSLSAHPNVVTGSVRRLVSSSAALTLEDAAEITTMLVKRGLEIEVQGRRMPATSAEVMFPPPSTSTTPVLTTVSESSSVPTSDASTSAKGSASWQISVGVLGALLLVALVVGGAIYRKSRRTQANFAADLAPATSFENPTYSATTDGGILDTLYDDVDIATLDNDYDDVDTTMTDKRLFANPTYESATQLMLDDGNHDAGYMELAGSEEA
eukprot:m.30101 g.30101  ORF g.30101 m.30101 type:complete len:2800 (-) comp10579_c1_seq1:225-8624(-)